MRNIERFAQHGQKAAGTGENRSRKEQPMNQASQHPSWVYVAVEDPGGNEKYMGLHDESSDTSYIPAFSEKDDALACMYHFPRRPGKKYEVQAVLLEELAEDARKNGFMIFMLDGQGRILKQIRP